MTTFARSMSPQRRRKVFERDQYTCQHCGAFFPLQPDGKPSIIEFCSLRTRRYKVHSLEVDHIYPYFHGGSNALENLQALCTPCNARKGAKV